MNTESLLDWIGAPTIAATKNNKHKSVRALGQVAAFTIMLPWTLFIFVLAVIGFIVSVCGIAVLEWWDSV